MVPAFLRWADVEPATHPLDASAVRAVVRPLVLGALTSPKKPWPFRAGFTRETLEAALVQALTSEVGAWAGAFTWAASEPGGGGPVRTYCCARDSLLLTSDPSVEATVDRVVASVSDLHAFFVDLARRFDELAYATLDLPVERAWEHAAAALVPVVLERTHAEDAWYATFAKVFGWYVESTGHPLDPRIDAIVRGRFESWVEPSAEATHAVAAELGRTLADPPVLPPDDLAEWAKVRSRAFAQAPVVEPLPLAWDGHARFIERHDRARDPARADRMAQALAACRASAKRGERLDFELLSTLQALVLGVDSADLRTGDAFAKGGRDRYAHDVGLRKRFEGWLAESNDLTTPAPVRAARVYLDVCFAHPFDDGNARAARLALDHVLTREGLVLRAVEPLFLVPRSPVDPQGAWALTWLVARLATHLP